jgi:hypothetical protein
MRSLWKMTTVTVPIVAYLALGWVAGLLVLTVWMVAVAIDLVRARAALAPTLRCPQGHAVPQYGLHRCGCGAVTESWVWRCPVCGASYGHTACPTCGLAVRNPLVR